jgi:hypothetical protein
MSTPAVANIIKSGAVLWKAPTGESNPDETSVAYGASWGGNWERLGYTKEPLTLAYESEEFDIEVDEVLAAVKRVRTGEGLTLETVLAELTAEYLQEAASDQDTVSETAQGASQKPYEETGLGGEPLLSEYKWGFEGLFVNASGDEEPVRVFIHKATATLNGELEFSQKSDDYTGVPIQIKALADTTQSAGQELMLFQRVTGETSS